MTNSTSAQFDDDDINDDELLAACNDIVPQKPDIIVPTGSFTKNDFT